MVLSPRTFSALALLTITFLACVPNRKFEEAESRSKAMQAEVDAANTKARDAQAAMEKMGMEMASKMFQPAKEEK